MKIVIIGPGAMGCLFAGLLTEAGEAVRLLDKYPERADLITQTGLRIEQTGRVRKVSVGATANAMALKGADVVCICVKAYDTGSTIQSLRSLVSSHTLVLSLQNGLGNVEQIATHIPHHQVFAGVTAHGSTLIGPGHIRHAGAGPTTISALRANNHSLAVDLAATLTKAGIETTAVQNMTSMLWSKLIVNAAIGPLSALSGLPNGQLLEHPEWRTLMFQVTEESAAVAARQSIRLLYDNPVRAVMEVCRNTAENFSSMLQDIQRGRPTEIDAINGAIIREAHRLGLSIPANESLVQRIRERSERR